MEECIKEKDNVVLDGDAVKEYRLRRGVEGVGHERRLNHNEGIINIFLVENVATTGYQL